MNFYSFHIGDYVSHTHHLTAIEDITYRRLLDLYYLQEKPLESDVSVVARMVRMSDHETVVHSVLNEFFSKTPEGWSNKRCDEEIAKYRSKAGNHWSKKLPKHVKAAMQGERNAVKANATPKWLSKEDRKAIAKVYAEAATLTAQTGIKHEVDHIVPLRSSVVCGLHVSWNLRAIPASKNREKSNFFEVA